jgi:hypothetical protein
MASPLRRILVWAQLAPSRSTDPVAYVSPVGWIDAELALVALAAMLSPTTLTFCVLVLVLAERPRRAGLLFYAGALGATLAVGVVAAFVIGDIAASDTSSAKTWVAIVDIVLAVLLLAWVARIVHRPVDPEKVSAMMAQVRKFTSAPAIAIVGAGAILANPGGFIPIALKDISETNPSAPEYIAEWFFFAIVSLLPLAVALVMLFVAPDRAKRLLVRVHEWLLANVMKIAAGLGILLAASLLRAGIAGLVND